MRIVITKRGAVDVPDGINVFIFSLASELIRKNHAVSVVTSTYSDPDKIRLFFKETYYPEIINLTTARQPSHWKTALLWIRKGKPTVDRLGADLVLINGAVPVRFDANNSVGLSHDLEARRLMLSSFARIAYKRFAYRRTHNIAATCSELRTLLAAELLVPADRITVIPPCFDLSSYISRPWEQRIDAILHMGTPDYKRPLLSMRALRNCCRGRLLITGDPTEAMKRELAAFPQGLRQRVEFLGKIPGDVLKDLLGCVKVVSVPSVYWAPVASPSVIEAMASGTPVVGTHSISTDVLRDGVNGFVCDPEDSASFGGKLLQLLQDAETWRSMHDAGLQTSKLFSATVVADKLLALCS